MMDALTIYGCVASMRHAGYFSFAGAVLGLAEAHYPGLRQAMRRVTAMLANARGRDAAALDRASVRTAIARKIININSLSRTRERAQNFRHAVGLGHSRSSLS
jgi:hypothetical protein